MPETVYCDGCLTGMMLNALVSIKAKELLLEIEAMFATGCVDEDYSGDLEDVKTENSLDIYQRYQEYYKRWG